MDLDDAARKSLESLWGDIALWYRSNGAEGMEPESEGYSESEISAFEEMLSAPLPSDYRSSLQLRRGAVEFYDYTYLPLKTVVRKWESMNASLAKGDFQSLDVIDPESDLIQRAWWHSGYVPFAADSSGNLLCIDVNPGPKGVRGQIVQWDTVEGPIRTKHGSFLSWLEAYRQDLHSGKYVVDKSGYLKKNTRT